MQITLDRRALRTLIESDKEFEVSLKGAVLAEVGRRLFDKDAAKIIEAAEPVLFAKALEAFRDNKDIAKLVCEALNEQLLDKAGSHFVPKRLSLKTRDTIEAYVEEEKARVVHDAQSRIAVAYGQAIQKALDDRFATNNIDELIEKRVSRLLSEEINRRVDEKFEAKMKEVRSVLD